MPSKNVKKVVYVKNGEIVRYGKNGHSPVEGRGNSGAPPRNVSKPMAPPPPPKKK